MNIQPLIRDRLATNRVFNPVMSYRTTFTVPPNHLGAMLDLLGGSVI